MKENGSESIKSIKSEGFTIKNIWSIMFFIFISFNGALAVQLASVRARGLAICKCEPVGRPTPKKGKAK